MKNGIIYEPIAKKKYGKKTKTFVHENGLFIHPQYNYLGASPEVLSLILKILN